MPAVRDRIASVSQLRQPSIGSNEFDGSKMPQPACGGYPSDPVLGASKLTRARVSYGGICDISAQTVAACSRPSAESPRSALGPFGIGDYFGFCWEVMGQKEF